MRTAVRPWRGNTPIRARLVPIAAVLLLAVDLVAASPKFTSSWKAPEASNIRFTGKRVAALVITSDMNLEMSAEEQLVRELAKRKIEGLAAYRIVPKQALSNSGEARGWFERAGVDGVISLRPVSAETVRSYSPSLWVSSSYATMWGYYDYGWTSVYTPGSMREDTTLVVETLIHSVPLNTLLWAGVSTTTNPKEAQVFIGALVEATIKEMKKQKLLK
jgi:hypothetical protein